MTLRIGVVTAGGDCPGLNAVIRGIVRTANSCYDATVVGFHDGWNGLVNNLRLQLYDNERIDKILNQGGTILGTGRMNTGDLEAQLDSVKETLADNEIDAVIPIGGDGTLRGARWLMENGINVVGVPKTIDNDVANTDYTFGFDTAVSIATDAIDRLHTTAESHQRIMLVEVMGRNAGWIALHAGMAGGAHMVVIPEVPFDVNYIEKVMERRFQMGESYGICVVAEGAMPKEGTMDVRSGGIDEFGHKIYTGVAQQLGDELKNRTGRDVRTTVLGHIQRGGTPTAFDRVLGTRFGVNAVHAVANGDFGKVVALHGDKIELITLDEAVGHTKLVPPERYAEMEALFG
ncbi:MAG: 6-phosphofructokinase [Lawsonella sp.]|nr:6-phosphofructokinase [Mycobacteriales bacterium]